MELGLAMLTILVLILIATLVALAVVTTLWSRSRSNAEVTRAKLDGEIDACTELRQRLAKSETELTSVQPRLQAAAAEATKIELLSGQISGLQREMQDISGKFAAAQQENTRLASELEFERKQTEAKIALLDQARTVLAAQFKALATEALDENSQKFTSTSATNLSQILQPFKEDIKNFRERVETIHTDDAQQKGALSSELAHLKTVSLQMTTEAHELATALKGQKKMQGNWGELVLGNVLDRSGLREGADFRREVSFNTEEGRRRPDVIVYLPESKHLVIDAKVSLNAYTRYVNAEDDLSRQEALKEHVGNISARINELAQRNYFDLPGLNSPEMVFMFVPIESAFVEALRADDSLFQKAIERNVLVATPTTLLTSLNIVRQLWRFEKQNEHTAELGERAAKVYQKLNTFLGTMGQLDRSLGSARKAYDTAINQLVAGKDNLIKQANSFKDLGVSIGAALPPPLVARAELELDYLPEGISDTTSPDDEAS